MDVRVAGTTAVFLGAAILLVSLRSLAGAADDACDFCVHDQVQHRFRIEGHPIFRAVDCEARAAPRIDDSA